MLSVRSRDFLKSLREQCHQYLLDDFLPYMETTIIDEVHGGFKCHTNRIGENIDTNKRTWFDGRGIWVYSFLYEYFGREKKYLEVAQKTVGLILKVQPQDNSFWPEGYTSDGSPLSHKPGDIYGGLFVAEGLIAFAQASGKTVFREMAKNILLNALKQYDRENYQYAPHYNSTEISIQAPRVLGHWMAFLNVSRQLLEQESDLKIIQICDRCIESLLEHHLRPDLNIMIEYLNHDLSIPTGWYSQFSYIGHDIECLWMLMVEAERRKDETLFSKTAELFRRHIEIAWDDVYGGFFHCLKNIDGNEWLLEKVLWLQEEVMVGLMILIEKEEDEWALQWAPKVWEYLKKTFVLQGHPARLWINGGDRRLFEHYQMDRMENYHHPRHLMFNLLRLDRIL